MAKILPERKRVADDPSHNQETRFDSFAFQQQLPMKIRRLHTAVLVKLLCLVGGAFFLLLFPGSPVAFSIVSVLAATIGLVDLFVVLTQPRKLTFAGIFAVAILLGYAGGTVVFLLGTAGIDATEVQYWARYRLYYDQTALSESLAICLIASVALYVRAAFERPPMERFPLPPRLPERAYRLMWLASGIVIVSYWWGDFGYMGAKATVDEGVSPIGRLANIIVPAASPILVLIIASQASTAKRLLPGALFLFFVATLFLLGRRYLMVAAVLSVLALFMSGYRIKRSNLWNSVLLGGLAFLTVVFGFYFFFAVRAASVILGSDASLDEILRVAPTFLLGAEGQELGQRLGENVASRPFILSYFAILLGTESDQMPLFGQELVLSLQMSIPSALMPGKLANLFSSPEALTHPRYGFSEFDGPNSIVVAGFDDFGVFGALVYPLAFAVVYRAFFAVCSSITRNQVVRLFVFFTLVFQLLYVEQTLTATIVTMRDVLLLILVFKLFNAWVAIFGTTREVIDRTAPQERNFLSTPGGRGNRRIG